MGNITYDNGADFDLGYNSNIGEDLFKKHGDSIGDIRFSCNVAGTTFVPDSKKVLKYLKENVYPEDIRIEFVREADNKYDKNAVAVVVGVEGSSKKYRLGYIPKDKAPVAAYALDNNTIYGLRTENPRVFGGTEEKPNYGLYLDFFVVKK